MFFFQREIKIINNIGLLDRQVLRKAMCCLREAAVASAGSDELAPFSKRIDCMAMC